MLLSVLIPTLPIRYETHHALLINLLAQQDRLGDRARDVEILSLLDNRQRSVGTKRNDLKRIAAGEYIVYVDDDDALDASYLSSIVDAITLHEPDVVTFKSAVTINGGLPLPCIFSMHFDADRNLQTHYERLPNHLCPVRRSIAPDFPNKSFGEDGDYAVALKPKLKSQVFIDKTIYHYRYSRLSSQTIGCR